MMITLVKGDGIVTGYCHVHLHPPCERILKTLLNLCMFVLFLIFLL